MSVEQDNEKARQEEYLKRAEMMEYTLKRIYHGCIESAYKLKAEAIGKSSEQQQALQESIDTYESVASQIKRVNTHFGFRL